MDNLFDYLQKYAQVDAGTLTRARQDVAEGRSGSLSREKFHKVKSGGMVLLF